MALLGEKALPCSSRKTSNDLVGKLCVRINFAWRHATSHKSPAPTWKFVRLPLRASGASLRDAENQLTLHKLRNMLGLGCLGFVPPGVREGDSPQSDVALAWAPVRRRSSGCVVVCISYESRPFRVGLLVLASMSNLNC